ncbi:MAG: adenylate/guanylate cyclase domain-containing protein [Gammaproteobacteria bacterium]|nr:adenylate/guanylate cyclase domain-containing protein [Gammaproteobacteria bacterium]MBU1645551.1 adenylate/guanylate cyclase domain-containing protein [Gammaproteobacteria bacterium]MBU1973647.1 adenylate/guanylate cyclase domain-containing protein [Gammaproteobacteria bacterium]
MTTLRQLFRHGWVLALVTTLFAACLAEGLYRTGAADRLEHLYSDVWHRVAGQRHAPAHAALVMIDDPSLNARPDEPLAFWTPHLARALATLKAVGARDVAVDFIFSGSPERWIQKLGLMAENASREYDRPFREQINQGHVLLAGFRVGAGSSIDDFVLPSPDYLLALPEMDMVRGIGLANLRADPDSAVRRFALTEAAGEFARKEGMPILGFGPLAAVRTSGQDPRAGTFRFGSRELAAAAELRIAFAGPPGTFKAVSFEKLLRDDATSLPEVLALAGKVVILGAGYAGMNDVHPTPYSTSIGGENALMSGPEIQANIVETMLGGHFVEASPAPVRIAAFLLLFGALAFVGVRLAPWRAVILVVLAAQATALVAYLMFKQDMLFPVAHLHIGMIVVLGCLALMRLTREERERARIGVMFGRYVSDQVMAAMMNSPELPELGGKSAQITVLFSDIRNFTTISEKLEAKEVVEMLNNYLERACAVLLAEGATIDKFIGDAIMAEFGAPLPQQDHARRAVRAAVALRRVAIEFRGWMARRFAGRDLPEFDIGIGLHSGEAVVGNIGSSARMEYTAIGDTVNIASRLEGMTKSTNCTILASRDTVAACGTDVRTGALHSLQVKGRHQPVEAYEVISDEN